MADRVKYDKMLEEEMFPHLLTLNPPNLVKIHRKLNLLQIFIENLSKKKKIMKNLPSTFLLWQVCLSRGG